MTGIELTIITGVAFILVALERVFASTRQTETIECLRTMARLLQEIRDDAQKRNVEIVQELANLSGYFGNFLAGVGDNLTQIDMALHGDYDDPVRKTLNPLSRIEDYLSSIDNRVADINLALESDTEGAT